MLAILEEEGSVEGFQFLGIPPKGEPDCRLWAGSGGGDPWFPISRDPPEGGTIRTRSRKSAHLSGFQFLGIPPKGEQVVSEDFTQEQIEFPISRDPPEGGTAWGIIPNWHDED